MKLDSKLAAIRAIRPRIPSLEQHKKSHRKASIQYRRSNKSTSLFKSSGAAEKEPDPPEIPKFKLGEALTVFFKLFGLYGLHFSDTPLEPRCCHPVCVCFSYVVDLLCLLPYGIYCFWVVDPYHSTRGSSIFWYLFIKNLFTFGFSRLIMKSYAGKLKEIRTALMNMEVEGVTFLKAKSYSAAAVFAIIVSTSLSVMILVAYLIYFYVVCQLMGRTKDRHCETHLWMYFSFYSALTALSTGVCFFSFVCIAFSLVCCLAIRHNLQLATKHVKSEKKTARVLANFKAFCKVHVDTQLLIDLIDSVFSKIPFIVILSQMSSVSIILRIPTCTYNVFDEKILAFCSCIANIAMYLIVFFWGISAAKLNQEFYSSCRVLSHILIKHKNFLKPHKVKVRILNYLIYVQYLKVKPVEMTFGGYSFAETLLNAKVFQYTLDLVNLI